MNENRIKPVAWTSETQLAAVRLTGDGIMMAEGRGWGIGLYEQSAIDHLSEQLNHYRMAAETEAGLADRRKAELDTLREAAIRARRSLALAAEENPRFVRAYNDLDAVLSPEAQG